MFAIQPKNSASDEGSNWEGTVTQLNKSMKKELGIVETKFSKRVSGLQSEITTLGSTMTSLSRELDEIKGSCQRLPKMEDIERSMRRIIKEEVGGRGPVMPGSDGPRESLIEDEGTV